MRNLEQMKKYLTMLEKYQLKEFLTSLDIHGNFDGEKKEDGRTYERFWGKILEDEILYQVSTPIHPQLNDFLVGKNLNGQEFYAEIDSQKNSTISDNIEQRIAELISCYGAIAKSIQIGIKDQDIQDAFHFCSFISNRTKQYTKQRNKV